MAINYNAGFLPQGLYQNLMNIQQAGLERANQQERDRWNQLGQLGAAFVKGNINMGDKAQEAYTKNYDIQRKRLTDTMEKLDPRSGDYENYKNAIANLDSEYTNKMQAFQESGFLGNLGRDRDMLSGLTNYEPGSYSPDSTAAAYALTDDKGKKVNTAQVETDFIPQKLMATAQGNMQVGKDPAIQEYEQYLYDRDSSRETKKLDAALNRDIQKIQQQGANSANVANINNAGALERAQLGATDQQALQQLRQQYLETQIAGQKDENAARLALLEAKQNPAAKPAMTENQIWSLATNLVKNKYGENPVDQATYMNEVEDTVNMLRTRMGAGPASTGIEAPSKSGLYKSEPEKKSSDPPKITQLPQKQTMQLESQIRFMESRVNGLMGFGAADAATQKQVGELATNARKLVDLYNKTPDSDTERKQMLKERIAQYATAIYNQSKQL